MRDAWLVVVDKDYYPTVHPCDSESDALKVFERFRVDVDLEAGEVVYLVEVAKQDKDRLLSEYRHWHDGFHCAECRWALQ